MKLRSGLAIAAIVGLGGTAAYAGIPDDQGVITGCIKKDGNVRVIDTNDPKPKDAKCKSDELTIQWNQTGPRGPVGPAGPPGPAGPAGLTLFANIRADGTLANGGGTASAAKFDPAVFGSGYLVTFTSNVSACAAVASPGQTGFGVAQSDAIASSNVDTLANKNQVFVQFKSTAGNFVDTDFHLIVACA